jgi:hypothetical protein
MEVDCAIVLGRMTAAAGSIAAIAALRQLFRLLAPAKPA